MKQIFNDFFFSPLSTTGLPLLTGLFLKASTFVIDPRLKVLQRFVRKSSSTF